MNPMTQEVLDPGPIEDKEQAPWTYKRRQGKLSSLYQGLTTLTTGQRRESVPIIVIALMITSSEGPRHDLGPLKRNQPGCWFQRRQDKFKLALIDLEGLYRYSSYTYFVT